MKLTTLNIAAIALVVLVALGSCQADHPVNKYTATNLWSLYIQDVMRWVTIGEDILAAYVTKLLDGALDKKSVKLAIRFALEKMWSQEAKLRNFYKRFGIDFASFGL